MPLKLFFYFRCDFEVKVMRTLGSDKDIPKGKCELIPPISFK